jgi:hypothetical protein
MEKAPPVDKTITITAGYSQESERLLLAGFLRLDPIGLSALV